MMESRYCMRRSATTWTHPQRRQQPHRRARYPRWDAGGSSFRARCRRSRIRAGHWRCCASGRMARGNDELSSCNGTGQTMTCRLQGSRAVVLASSATKRCVRQCHLEHVRCRKLRSLPSQIGRERHRIRQYLGFSTTDHHVAVRYVVHDSSR